MTNNNVQEFKSLGNGLYVPYYKKIARVNLRNNIMSISGEVVDISDIFMKLRHRDGRETLIRLSEIASIGEVPRREAVSQ